MPKTSKVYSRVVDPVFPQRVHPCEPDVIQDHQRARLHYIQDSRDYCGFKHSILGAIHEHQIGIREELTVPNPDLFLNQVSDNLRNIWISLEKIWNRTGNPINAHNVEGHDLLCISTQDRGGRSLPGSNFNAKSRFERPAESCEESIVLARPHGYEITINTVDEALSHVVNSGAQTLI